MARINIEECWWSDPRRDYLRQLLSADIQDQVAIRCWRLAQEFWGKGKLIPWPTFVVLQGSIELLESGLAIVHQDVQLESSRIQLNPAELQQSSKSRMILAQLHAQAGVYVRGSSEYLEWVRVQRLGKQKGGETAAKRPRDAKGRLKKTSSKDLAKSSSPPAEIQQISSSSSYSGSVSGSDSDSNSNFCSDGVKNENFDSDESPPPEGLWHIYNLHWKGRYGQQNNPVRNAKVNSQLKQLSSRVPKEEHEKLIHFYINHQKPYYVQNMHGVGPLLADCESLVAQMRTGITSSGVHPISKSMAIKEHNDKVFAEAFAKIGMEIQK